MRRPNSFPIAMRKRALAGMAFVILFCVALAALPVPRRSLNEQDLKMVKEGMTRQEVESALRGRHDVQATWLSMVDTKKGVTYRDVKLWHCQSESVAVVFDDEEKSGVQVVSEGLSPDDLR